MLMLSPIAANALFGRARDAAAMAALVFRKLLRVWVMMGPF
jgi:hypothetical protein